MTTYTCIVRTYYDKEETELKEEFFLVNGKKEGDNKLYYSNGQIWCICSYINDKINSEYKSYDEYGDLIKHSIYENGIKIKDEL